MVHLSRKRGVKMTYQATAKTRVKRLHQRGMYDEETVHAILDAQPLCTVAYVFDGAPFATPTLQWREGNHIYWHGSSASRMLEACETAQVCVNVTILDGYVLARSAFNHSCNYRSVMAFGTARKISDAAEKAERLNTFVDALLPGRREHLRAMTAKEVKATMILGLELKEVSAKVRQGPPGDDEEDYAHPVWAGVLPVRQIFGAPIADSRLLLGLGLPEHIARFANPA
jgi:uncharacterized protein